MDPMASRMMPCAAVGGVARRGGRHQYGEAEADAEAVDEPVETLLLGELEGPAQRLVVALAAAANGLRAASAGEELQNIQLYNKIARTENRPWPSSLLPSLPMSELKPDLSESMVGLRTALSAGTDSSGSRLNERVWASAPGTGARRA